MAGIPFIAVEGPIGIGKTSLAKKLSSRFDFHLLKEIVDENPFLDKFYDDISEWSFQTEMFFLCNRYKQLEDIDKKFLQEGQPVVADYHIAKNMIFARRTLNGDQLAKCAEIYKILTADMPLPNVLIYITGSMETIVNRISKRGRDFEKNIEIKYLKQLSDDYDDFMDKFEVDHPEIPVIRVNGDELDFVERHTDLETILEIVADKLHGNVVKGAGK